MELKYPKVTMERIQDVWDKLGGEDGVDKLLNGKIVVQQFVSKPILRCILDDADLVIPACDGTHTLAQASDVFKSLIDPDFKNWGLDKSGKPTPKTKVAVHEMAKYATFAGMLGFFGIDLDKLCLTQHQIEIFCKKLTDTDWLRAYGYGTFFLTKKDWEKPATFGNFFIVRVNVDFVGLRVYAFRFERDYVWTSADYQHRLVVAI